MMEKVDTYIKLQILVLSQENYDDHNLLLTVYHKNMMNQYAEHVDGQLDNGLTCASFLLDAIKYNNPGLNAAIAMVKSNKETTGKKNKFEDASEYHNPWYPVANNSNNNSICGAAEISDSYGRRAQVSATGDKQGRGSTGAKFHYYKYDEFRMLSKKKHDKILEWHK